MVALALYDPLTASYEGKVFQQRGYACEKLTDRAKTFWDNVEGRHYTALVLYSHGNKDGPLLVQGDKGADMTDAEIKRLFAILQHKQANFYLLSCRTGNPPFADYFPNPGASSVQYAAPVGQALVKASSQSLNVFSVDPDDNKKYLPWIGTLGPTRLGKALTLP